MVEKLKYFAIGLLLLGEGAAIGRWLSPTKIQEKVVYQDKIVEKKVFVKDKTQKNNKVTIKLVTIKPDGTKTIETKIFDRSEIEITQNNSTTREEEKSETKEKVIENSKPDWFISATAKMNFNDFSMSYGGSVNRRIIGPFYLGVVGYSDPSAGLSIGLSF